MPLTEEDVKRHLSNIDSSADSITQTSAWIKSNKTDIDIITRTWYRLYEQGPDKLRIALIYVMNDVVQKSKHDKERGIPMAFHPHVVNAIAMASDEVKKPIQRCLNVFRERYIYPKHVIDEMIAAFAIETVEPDDGTVLEIDAYAKKLISFSDAANALDHARRILNSIDFELDVNDKRTKTRSGIMQIEEEVEQMIAKLKQFIMSIEAQSQRTKRVRGLTQKAISHFATQSNDVDVVHGAYDRFARGIKSTIVSLETMVKTSLLPGQAPPTDAPSPKPNEDPFADLLETGDDMDIEDDSESVTAQ